MRVDLFDFALPEELIALRPVEPRDAARLLVVGETLTDSLVTNLPNWLRPGDALVVNDTQVLPARLFGLRRRGETQARVEVLLHKREAPDRWRAFLRPWKRVAIDEQLSFGDSTGNACMLGELNARIVDKAEGGEVVLAFDFAGPSLDDAIRERGVLPLPPYIASKRAADAADARDYQTMFSNEAGAVAAPTAGLHFSPALVAALEARGVSIHRVTLHVGAGTFLPVKADDTADHVMHAETGIISAQTADALNAARAKGGRIVAIGTTSLRLLESATNADGIILPFAGDTAIFITPGYCFRAVDVLMTNFHLPRSTLFMLISAFAGLDRARAAYAHAIAGKYRFYSYGDACLFERSDPP